MCFFFIQHVLKHSKSVTVKRQAVNIAWRILIRKRAKLKNVEEIWRECALQTHHCINSGIMCLRMPQPGSLWENPLDLTWCNRAVHGWKTTLFFFFFAVVVTDFRTFNQQPDITQNSPIKHNKTAAHLKRFIHSLCPCWCLLLFFFIILWHIWFYAMTIKVNALASVSHLSNLPTRQLISCLLPSSILAPKVESNV